MNEPRIDPPADWDREPVDTDAAERRSEEQWEAKRDEPKHVQPEPMSPAKMQDLIMCLQIELGLTKTWLAVADDELSRLRRGIRGVA